MGLGIINNQNKNKFILEAILKRDSNTINKYIGKGDTIMTVGWILYFSWSCEFRLFSWTRNLGHGDFRFGLSSTLSIEFLWNALKNIIKNLSYYSI